MPMQQAGAGIAERTGAIIEDLKRLEGPLLPILHGIQHEFGYVPQQSLPVIAEALNLSRAEVYGVVSFYHHFRSTPPGRHRLAICRAESCQAMQGDALAAYAEQRLGVRFGETTADGGCTLEAVYCLGNCACSPAILIDDEPHGRVTPERLDALLAECSAADATGASG